MLILANSRDTKRVKIRRNGLNGSYIANYVQLHQDGEEQVLETKTFAREKAAEIWGKKKLAASEYIENPARKKTKAKKTRTAEKQYRDFHHKTGHKTITDVLDIPEKFVHIGKAVSLIYESDKFDGKKRLYKHDFKKHGNILAKPEGANGFSDLILMNNLKFKIKKEGITG
jgi:hypothetical protein